MFCGGMKTTLFTVEWTKLEACDFGCERAHSVVFLHAPNLSPRWWGLVRKAEEERVQDRQEMGAPGWKILAIRSSSREKNLASVGR